MMAQLAKHVYKLIVLIKTYEHILIHSVRTLCTHYTVHSIQYTFYNVEYIACSVEYIDYSIQYTLITVYTDYSIH